MTGDWEMMIPLTKQRSQEKRDVGRRSKFGPGHVEFEVLATHDHEAGCGAGTPDIGSLKIDINT